MSAQFLTRAQSNTLEIAAIGWDIDLQTGAKLRTIKVLAAAGLIVFTSPPVLPEILAVSRRWAVTDLGRLAIKPLEVGDRVVNISGRHGEIERAPSSSFFVVYWDADGKTHRRGWFRVEDLRRELFPL